MKKLLLLILFIYLPHALSAQHAERVWRAEVMNPGIELEQPVSGNSTFSIHAGIGYSGSYPNLSKTAFDSGILYAIAPFIDLQFKRFYNFEKRLKANREIERNSGNFISLRFRSRGKSLHDNFERKTNYDFAIGPTWGIQRSYGKFHLLLDVGPQFYFDTDGNTGIWPLMPQMPQMPQINIGFNLN